MNADTFRKLAALGLTHDQMAGVLEIIEADAETRKEKARARVQRWREKKRDETPRNVTERNVTQQDGSREGVTRVEDNLLTKKISGKEEKKESAAKPRGVDDFIAELSPILDAERIDALVAVRRKKGATFSALAGRSLAKALRSWPNVNEAADEMVLRNWTGFKPDWMAKRSTGPPSKPKSIGDIFRDDAKRMGIIPNDNPPDPPPERLAISDRSRESSSPGIARRFAVPSNLLGKLG